ncbi:MAG: hypothetical protein KOO60_07450 [Gemmatimonadales bacterium]|nr:hypothetical protein [Gemmatimonadales bacterium]
MAAFSSKKTTVTFSGLTLEMGTVTVTANVAVENVTVTQLSDFVEQYVVGMKDWTASFEGVLPLAGVGLTALGTSATLTIDFEETDSQKYSGTAICTNITPSGSAPGAGRVSISWQGNGVLAEAPSV